jgi:methyltransferase FkbM-like protein
LNRLIREAVFSLGYCLTPKVHDADVLRLIRNLRPRHCGRPLIRVGAEDDGGYLIPDDLAGIEYCFSPGVSRVAAFESQLADRNIKSFLADHSVSSPPLIRPEFTFDRKYVGATDSETCMTIAAWKHKYLAGYNHDLILQMDIEGAEYEALLSTPEQILRQFRIMVVEMHWLERLFDPFGFRIMNACFEKLLKQFYVVHLHPNNCAGCVRKDGIEVPHVLEITFYNGDRAPAGEFCTQFPHPLDADNCLGLPTLPLPPCWRQQ